MSENQALVEELRFAVDCGETFFQRYECQTSAAESLPHMQLGPTRFSLMYMQYIARVGSGTFPIKGLSPSPLRSPMLEFIKGFDKSGLQT